MITAAPSTEEDVPKLVTVFALLSALVITSKPRWSRACLANLDAAQARLERARGMSANYEFIVDLARDICPPPGRLLDFGCGAGEVVSKAKDAGYNAWGVDTFQDMWEQYANPASFSLPDHVKMISPGDPLPFEENSFDVVLSNQVFEHIPAIPRVAEAIARVLRPGGYLIAIFPTREIIVEPHLRAPFVHRLPLGSGVQRGMLRLSHRLGLTSAPGVSVEEWLSGAVDSLEHHIFYTRLRDVPDAFFPWFRVEARMEPQFMRDRLRRSSLPRLVSTMLHAPVFDSTLRWLCIRLANGVFVLRRSKRLDGGDFLANE